MENQWVPPDSGTDSGRFIRFELESGVTDSIYSLLRKPLYLAMAEDRENKIIISEEEEEEEAMRTQMLVPEGIIEEILSRLPVKSLLRFRCVCKPWYSLISDPIFVKMHLNQSLGSNRNLNLIFREYYDYYLYSVDLDGCEQQIAVKLDHALKFDYGIEVLGSCNGLLCISNSNVDILFWNPSTRKHQKLPITPIELGIRSRREDYVVYGFGYDPSTEDYKLVRVVQFYGYDNSLESEVKVYSLRTNSWRRIGGMPFPLLYSNGVLVNSVLHWVANRQTGPGILHWLRNFMIGPDIVSSFIVSFDLQDEEFREVSLPDFVEDKFQLNIGVLGGQLCVLCNFLSRRVEVWMMMDYGVKDSWVKRFSIEQPSAIRSFRYIRPICYSKNGGVILEKDSESLVLYDPRSGRDRNLRIRGVPYGFTTETCVGSLVPLNTKDGTEQA